MPDQWDCATITISVQELDGSIGTRAVAGWQLRGSEWAVHPAIDEPAWVATHVPTGWSANDSEIDELFARQWAVELAKIIPPGVLLPSTDIVALKASSAPFIAPARAALARLRASGETVQGRA